MHCLHISDEFLVHSKVKRINSSFFFARSLFSTLAEMFQNGDLLVFAIALHFGRSQECNSVGDIMYKELNCVPSSYDEVTHCPSSYQCNFYQLVDFCRNPGTTTVQHTVGHCSDCFCDASSYVFPDPWALRSNFRLFAGGKSAVKRENALNGRTSSTLRHITTNMH